VIDTSFGAAAAGDRHPQTEGWALPPGCDRQGWEPTVDPLRFERSIERSAVGHQHGARDGHPVALPGAAYGPVSAPARRRDAGRDGQFVLVSTAAFEDAVAAHAWTGSSVDPRSPSSGVDRVLLPVNGQRRPRNLPTEASITTCHLNRLADIAVRVGTIHPPCSDSDRFSVRRRTSMTAASTASTRRISPVPWVPGLVRTGEGPDAAGHQPRRPSIDRSCHAERALGAPSDGRQRADRRGRSCASSRVTTIGRLRGDAGRRQGHHAFSQRPTSPMGEQTQLVPCQKVHRARGTGPRCSPCAWCARHREDHDREGRRAIMARYAAYFLRRSTCRPPRASRRRPEARPTRR
jgi:hypothetical protein